MAGGLELLKDRQDIRSGLRRLDDGDPSGIFPDVLNLQVFSNIFERQEIIFERVDGFDNETVELNPAGVPPLQNHAAAKT